MHTKNIYSILRLLHAHPWLSQGEMIRTLGIRESAASCALASLKRAGAVIVEIRGVQTEGTARHRGAVRQLPCYAIAPVEASRDITLAHAPLLTTEQRVIEALKRNGGNLTTRDIKEFVPDAHEATICKICHHLMDAGKAIQEEDQRVVGKGQFRRVKVYTLKGD